jgi:hypothetical protein
MRMTTAQKHARLGWAVVSSIAVLALVAGCATAPTAPSVLSSAGISSGPQATLAIPAGTPFAVASVEPAATADAVDPGDGAEYELPPPTCPSPAGAVIVPDIRVSVGDGPAVIAGRGSSTFATCTTTASTDAAGDPRLPWLTATHRDRLRLQVQTGWRILRIEGYDSPATGDGANITPAIDLADRPAQVEVAVPARDGDTRAAWTLWLIRVDGKAVGQVTVTVRLHLPAGS